MSTTTRKTVCPISLADFVANAKPMTMTLDGPHGKIVLQASIKAPFSTGSFGWYVTGQGLLEINGVQCKVQIGENVTLVGSKPDGK